MSKRVICQNEYFCLYLSGDNTDELHLDSASSEEQEDSEGKLTQEDKIKKLDHVLNHFCAFWKTVEGSEKMYKIFINIQLVMIIMSFEQVIKIKNLLDDIRPSLIKNLDETYIYVEHKVGKMFLDLLFSVYTPVKPIHII